MDEKYKNIRLLRGEIWWCVLPEPVYKRPVLIIQDNHFNTSPIDTVIAAMITSNLKLAGAPGNVLIRAKDSKLPKDSVIKVSQILTVDKLNLIQKVNKIPTKIMAKVEVGLCFALSLNL